MRFTAMAMAVWSIYGRQGNFLSASWRYLQVAEKDISGRPIFALVTP